MDHKDSAINEPLPNLPNIEANRATHNGYERRLNESNEVAWLMLVTMVLELQKNIENLGVYNMTMQLQDMLRNQARQDCFNTVHALVGCKMTQSSSFGVHILKM